MKFLRTILAMVLFASASLSSSWGFSLLGPYKSWMTQDLGYRTDGNEIGGGMLASEGYRWNVPTLFYAYDRSFLEYFGVEGVAAVEQAIKMINDLPPFSTMSADLSEYPLSTKQVNYEAQDLSVMDVKSRVLPFLLEELGLANPERYVWAIRGRNVPTPNNTNYSVIKLNYDPVTFAPSSYVNGALYTYEIIEFDGGGLVTVAAEIKIGDLRTVAYSSVVGGSGAGWESGFQSIQDPATGIESGGGSFTRGEYYVGLTRDDVGGLRYLYRPQRQHVEFLHPDVRLRSGGTSGGVWVPPGGGTATNGFLTGTNLAQALRPGVDKITFQQVQFDSLLTANFQAFDHTYTDTYITNFQTFSRQVSRRVVRPDIIFTASDLGLGNAFPVNSRRTETTGWQNNAGVNTFNNTGQNNDLLFGPGTIVGPIEIQLSDMYPAFSNGTPGRTGEGDGLSIAWASFDGSPETPILYPKFGSVNTDVLRGFNLGNNFNSPWTAVTVSVVTTNSATTTNP